MTLEKKVAAVDDFLAPRWFKTVTRATWVAGNFVATDYSIDESRGRPVADRANEPPLPVLIRYLCEFHASDLAPDLAQLELPLLLVQPTFTEGLRSDTKRSYLSSYFEEPWQGFSAQRPETETIHLDGAGILVMDDRPAEVEQAIAGFLERHAH
ncbi:MAG: hypothetical protein HOP15_16470 [Planctomycetes bacterium]|nr:hypothetical protein [Planctomycetota bacterium]